MIIQSFPPLVIYIMLRNRILAQHELGLRAQMSRPKHGIWKLQITLSQTLNTTNFIGFGLSLKSLLPLTSNMGSKSPKKRNSHSNGIYINLIELRAQVSSLSTTFTYLLTLTDLSIRAPAGIPPTAREGRPSRISIHRCTLSPV